MRIYETEEEFEQDFDNVIGQIRKSVSDQNIDRLHSYLDNISQETDKLREYCNGLNLTLNRSLFEIRERLNKLEKRNARRIFNV